MKYHHRHKEQCGDACGKIQTHAQRRYGKNKGHEDVARHGDVVLQNAKQGAEHIVDGEFKDHKQKYRRQTSAETDTLTTYHRLDNHKGDEVYAKHRKPYRFPIKEEQTELNGNDYCLYDSYKYVCEHSSSIHHSTIFWTEVALDKMH